MPQIAFTVFVRFHILPLEFSLTSTRAAAAETAGTPHPPSQEMLPPFTSQIAIGPLLPAPLATAAPALPLVVRLPTFALSRAAVSRAESLVVPVTDVGSTFDCARGAGRGGAAGGAALRVRTPRERVREATESAAAGKLLVGGSFDERPCASVLTLDLTLAFATLPPSRSLRPRPRPCALTFDAAGADDAAAKRLRSMKLIFCFALDVLCGPEPALMWHRTGVVQGRGRQCGEASGLRYYCGRCTYALRAQSGCAARLHWVCSPCRSGRT